MPSGISHFSKVTYMPCTTLSIPNNRNLRNNAEAIVIGESHLTIGPVSLPTDEMASICHDLSRSHLLIIKKSGVLWRRRTLDIAIDKSKKCCLLKNVLIGYQCIANRTMYRS